MLREVDKNFELLKEKYQDIRKSCQYLLNVMENKEKYEFDRLIEELIKIQPFSSLGNLIGQNNWNCSNQMKKLLMEYRQNYDKIIYESTDFLSKQLINTLPEQYKGYIDVMSLEEIKDNSKINKDLLEKRKNGYIYYNGEIHYKELSDFCKEQNFMIHSNIPSGDIKGSIAYGGIVKGTVKIILNSNDFTKFHEGDILVTTMTTPRFTSIMKMAAGIITDEGGITCHASIIARELKKPCIVGCKNATEILKDNMKVELDAINGIVKIL